MPTYEYACNSCGNRWDEIQKISEEPLRVCPKCNKESAQRLISGGNFILKGGGWYADLYSSSGSKSSDTSSSSTSTSTTVAPKAESTPAPAPKSETKSGDSK